VMWGEVKEDTISQAISFDVLVFGEPLKEGGVLLVLFLSSLSVIKLQRMHSTVT